MLDDAAMQTISGYTITEKLYESEHSLVFRACRDEDARPVILKLLKETYPSPEHIAQFKHEYEITRDIAIAGVARIYDLVIDPPHCVKVMEDFGGDSLRRLELAGNLALPDFLHLTIQVTEILGQIHQHRIIHKDVNPANIVLNPNTAQLKFIDFGIATRFSDDHEEPPSNHMEGTLAYVSPEQTGRMNQLVDYRTDFYSLGVTFYELLTGQLPFSVSNALELVHCHIARQPASPHDLDLDIPETVADIILKLMAKNADDRYQSACGLKFDLEECLRQWNSTGQIAPFPPGQHDRSPRFRIPRKLYGREQERETLLRLFGQARQGSCALLLISSQPGMGKTAMVEEVAQHIDGQRGYFISGRFDQGQCTAPYVALIQAFRSLMQHLLTESDVAIAAWRHRLLEVIPANDQVILSTLPELGTIIGTEQLTVCPLPGAFAPSTHHLELLFQQLISIFAQPEHPLVIFLDDLQWANETALNLLHLLLTPSADAHHLLIIGAYQSTEVSPTHPINALQETLQQAGTLVKQIELAPLETPSIALLLAETLYCEEEQAMPLAELVRSKTGGTPFFVNEFLKSLYAEGLLTFNHQQGQWTWDYDAIQLQTMTDNVVDLMAERVQRLAPRTQQLLQLAAAIGNQFDLELLAMAAEQSPADTARHMREAILEDLVLPLGDAHRYVELDLDVEGVADNLKVEYKFAHDRIQQTIYALMPREEQQKAHQCIGWRLLRKLPAEQYEEHIFDIVGQLNQSHTRITDAAERQEVARLNLLAGTRASIATDYESARAYVRTGTEVLSSEGWHTSYDLTLSLHREYARCAYLSGDQDQAEQIFATALAHARTNLDQAELYNSRMTVYSSQGKLKEVIETGTAAINLLGMDLPIYPDRNEIEQEIALLNTLQGNRSAADLIDLPQMTDPQQLMIMRLLNDILVNAWWTTNRPLLYLATLKITRLSIEHGNADTSPFGYVWYGMHLGSEQGDYKRGYEFGELAFALIEKTATRYMIPRLGCIHGVFVAPWRTDLKACLKILHQGYQVGLELGEDFWTGTIAYAIVYSMIIKGDELEEIYQESQKYLDFARRIKQRIPTNMITISQQFILSLQGKTRKPGSFSDSTYQEEQHIHAIRESGAIRPLFWYYKIKMQALYLSDLYEDAYQVALESRRVIEQGASFGVVTLQEHYFYYSLILAARYKDASPLEQGEYWQILTRNQENMRLWSRNCPENYRHKYLLISAEIARLQGAEEAASVLYDQAIIAAHEHHYIQNEALANELAARFYLARKQETIARGYLLKARNGYMKWGAMARVKLLDKKYTQLIAEARLAAYTPDSHGRLTTTTTTYSRSTTASTGTSTTHGGTESLDISTVLKASQAISGDIVLETLLSKMIKMVIENAGAQRGCLILEKQGQWVIEAEGAIDTSSVTVLQSIPINSRQALPLPTTIINYVLHTTRSIVLGNASQEGQFTQDEYIRTRKPRSILCMPLIKQGKLTGILYLENNLTSGAFTPERLEVLNLLAAQAAISIENAMLYTTLEQKVAERTAQLAEANQEITMLYERIKAENLRLEAEVEVARQIQQMLLPGEEEIQSVPNLDIASFMEPAHEVGGDYYDMLQHEDQITFGIGDVTGHGLESGVLMLMVQTAIRTLLNSGETDTTRFFSILNRTVYDTVQRMRVDKSLTLALLTYQRGTLRLSGQHEQIIVVRQGGAVELVDTLDLGIPLGLDDDIATFFSETSLHLQPGDGIVLYTDGITEAENLAGEQYELARLCDIISRHWHQPAEEIKMAVLADVRQHIGTQKVYDDLTLVVMKQQ